MDAHALMDILPCAACGLVPESMAASRPEGRTRPVFRLECSCGEGRSNWSVSESGAVRLWNARHGRRAGVSPVPALPSRPVTGDGRAVGRDGRAVGRP